MKKPILITLLCAGLMLVTPLTSVARENTISSNLSEKPDTSEYEDDCNLCAKKVSKSHLVLISSLLNKFEKDDNQLSLLTKHYPEIADLYIELSDIISIFKKMKTDTKPNLPNSDFPIICEIFYRIANRTYLIIEKFWGLYEFLNKPYRPIRNIIAFTVSWVVYLALMGFLFLGSVFGCWGYY